MSRWNGRRARSDAAASSRTERNEERERERSEVLVEDYDGLLLLRSPTDETLLSADVSDLARVLRAEDGGTVTIVAVAEGDASALWSRLSELLDSLRESGTRSVRLVMSDAGRDRPDRPAPARRIADAWDLTVEAPDGPVLVVPGGSVFVPPGDGGWWRFTPGQEPEVLGPRAPAPDWQAAVRRVPARTADGCVVDQIPAGLLIRPAEAAPARPGDLFHAIPVDPRRPAVVVGVPWGEDVLATDVAELLGALPAAVRPGVRLAPGGRRDLLPLGQSVAGLLNAEVEVTTGLPLFAAAGRLGTYGIRSVLAGPDGDPRWLPFVDAVMCPVPEPGNSSAPAPRLLRWSSPVPDLGGSDDGVIVLSDDWQATVTRAGLWVAPRDGTPPPVSVRPVSIEGPIVEVGRTGDRVDVSLWPVLSRLLGRLAPDLRARTTLHVHATPTDGGHALRALAADHALRVVRFAPPAPVPRPLPRGGAVARAGGTAIAAVPRPMAVTGAAGDTATAGSTPPTGTTSTALAALPAAPAPRRARATAHGESGPTPARPATVSGRPPTGGPGSPSPTSSPAESPAEPPTEPPTEPSAEPIAEPVTGLVSTRVSGPPSGAVSSPVSAPTAEPVSRTAVAEATVSESAPGAVSSPVSAPTAEPVSRTAVAEPTVSGPTSGTVSESVPGPTAEPTVSESAPGPVSGLVSVPEAPRPEPVATGAPSAPAVRVSPAEGVAPEPTGSEPAPEPTVFGPLSVPEAPRPEPVATGAPPAPAEGVAAGEEAPRERDDGPAVPLTVPVRVPASGARPPAEAPGGAGDTRPLPGVPVSPRHRSTTPERASFRTLAEPVWERHSAAVNRALAGMPALRGEEQEAARVDLIALRMYLQNDEAPLDHEELTTSLQAGEQRLVPYAACLASGLGRLPSYRGAVLRGMAGSEGHRELRPGVMLRDPAPLSGLPLDPAGKARVAGVGFAIWSITGRRVRQLLDGDDEVVFAPGTTFKVLDVRTGGAAPLVLLRQLPDTHTASNLLDDADETALVRLDHVLTDRLSPGTGDWPDRCAGPVGDH